MFCELHLSISYSQTFENRSSLVPPNCPPPAGLLCTGGGLLAAGVTGAALLQPPKSSSGATFGVGFETLPNSLPNTDDWVFEAAGVFPQAEKSVDIGMVGFRGGAGLGFGALVVAEGSGVAHASLEPQGSSLFEKLENAVLVAFWADGAGFGVGCEGAAGAERLKAELMLAEGADAGVGAWGFLGAVMGGAGSENPKRSFEALVVADWIGAGDGADAKLKSPKSLEALGAKLAWGVCGAFDAIAGFEASLGPASKKPPPLRGGDVICGAATADR